MNELIKKYLKKFSWVPSIKGSSHPSKDGTNEMVLKIEFFFSFLNIHVEVVFVEPINPPLPHPTPPTPLTYGDI
jgi:hypothetical protein